MMQTLHESAHPEFTKYHKQLKSLANKKTTIHNDQLFQILSQFKSPANINLSIIEEIQSICILTILLHQNRTEYLKCIFTMSSVHYPVSTNGQGLVSLCEILIPLATLYENHPSIFQKCIIFNNFNFLFPSIEDCQSYFMALEDTKYHSFAENKKIVSTIFFFQTKRELKLNRNTFTGKRAEPCTVHYACINCTVHV